MKNFLIIFWVLFYPKNVVIGLDIPIIMDLQEVIGLAHDVADMAVGKVPLSDLFNTPKDPLVTIVNKVNEISDEISKLNQKLDSALATILLRIPLEGQINDLMKDLQRFIDRIDAMYGLYLDYTSDLNGYHEDTILEFIEITTSMKGNNLPDILEKIFHMIVPEKSALDRTGLLSLILQKRNATDTKELCNLDMSFQHRMLKIYNVIVVAELKAFAMATFSFRMKNDYKKTSLTGEVNRFKTQFIMRAEQYMIEIQHTMKKASREIYRCDPNSYIHGETFVEFEGLFTYYVMNEYQISVEKPCSGKCNEFWTTSFQRCYILNQQKYCPQHQCKGLLHDCGWIGGAVDICELPKGTRRRYDYIRSYENGFYGEWSDCENGTYNFMKGVLWHMVSCDMCLCICSEENADSLAIRTVSMKPQISDVENNKVVSDIRFTEKDNMIHIQIEESPLLPAGQFQRNNSSWVELGNFKYLTGVSGGGFAEIINGQSIPLMKYMEYSFISRKQKIINLDELIASPNYVLTGIQFQHAEGMWFDDTENNSPLQIEIMVTPFDFATGKLILSEDNPPLWLTPHYQPKQPHVYTKERTEIKKGTNSYKYGSATSTPDVMPNQFITFQASADGGQSTVPFFDSRPVAPDNSLAYNGIGLIHRGHEKYAGFLAFKLLTLDLVNHLKPQMTTEQANFYQKSYRKPLRHNPPILKT